MYYCHCLWRAYNRQSLQIICPCPLYPILCSIERSLCQLVFSNFSVLFTPSRFRPQCHRRIERIVAQLGAAQTCHFRPRHWTMHELRPQTIERIRRRVSSVTGCTFGTRINRGGREGDGMEGRHVYRDSDREWASESGNCGQHFDDKRMDREEARGGNEQR